MSSPQAIDGPSFRVLASFAQEKSMMAGGGPITPSCVPLVFNTFFMKDAKVVLLQSASPVIHKIAELSSSCHCWFCDVSSNHLQVPSTLSLGTAG